MKRPAVFFDRDNTLIICDGYLGDPSKVALVDGAAEAIARVRSLGFATVVFSNQSGVARGMFTEQDVHAVNARLDEVLQDHDRHAVIDRHEFCPFHPAGTVEQYASESDLRKPKPGMIFQAAEKLALDLSRSWVIGDAPRDIEAGKAAGCRTIWFKDPNLAPSSAAQELMLTVPDAVVSSLKEAVDVIARDALVRQASAPTQNSASENPAPASTTETPAETSEAASAPDAPAEPPQPEPEVARRSPPRSPAAASPLMQALARKKAEVQQPAESSPAPASAAGNARLETLAEQILHELRRAREHPDHDFSVSKLMAGVVQMMALAALIITYVQYRQSPEIPLLVALFLQTFTIALLIMGKQR